MAEPHDDLWRTKDDQDLSAWDIRRMRVLANICLDGFGLDQAGERVLREAIEDLWANIARADINQLQPLTREIARANHELLAHLEGR